MITNAEDVEKCFYVGGPIDPVRHYCVHRERETIDIVNLIEFNYVLLHAHRQAGKSSMIKPIILALTEKSANSITISVNLQGLEEYNFWESLWQRMHSACKTSPMMKFRSSSEFLDAFSYDNFSGRRVYLILDEIDHLLNLPISRESFLSALRSIRTGNTTTDTKPYAIYGILGIGVLHVNKLSDATGPQHSPFNVAQLFHLPQPQLHDIVQMFSEYGTTINCDLTVFTEDIFGRTGGHLGLASLLGKILQEWIHSFKPTNRKGITIGAWVGHLSNTRLLAGQIDASHSIHSILPCLSGKDEHIVTSRQILFHLMNGPEFMRDPSQQSKLDKDAVDFLEIIGVVVREPREGNIRFSAPLFRIVFFKYFSERIEKEFIPTGLVLPMINDSNTLDTNTLDVNTLDLIGCIQQSLPLFDREVLYHQLSLDTNGFPVDFAFHFQLHCILSRMASRMNWFTNSEARNAAGKNRKKLDIFVANNAHKYGFEILGDASKAELSEHCSRQANVYKKELSLRKVLMINFLPHLPQKRPKWWFNTDDVDISVVHVHLPQNGPVATIVRSVNSTDDIVVNLLGIGSRIDIVDNVHNVTTNLSSIRIQDPITATVIVGNTLFTLSTFPKISDFLADVKNEIVSCKEDIRLRLFSQKRKIFISASTDTLSAFSNFQDDDIVVTCGDENLPVTIK